MPETVLVTGATGFIAKHIVLALLGRGDWVRGSTRTAAGDAALRAALAPHLPDPAALDRLSTVRLDLLSDDGWDRAMDGVDTLIHTASPFPLVQPKDPDDLIRPAVDGTRRALAAAGRAGVRRVVMTSSVAAVSSRPAPGNGVAFTEDDWTDLSFRGTLPYYRSKTLAERAAWDFVAQEGPAFGLTVLNPGFVLGRPLDADIGTSLAVVARLLRGKDPMVPRVGFPVVDVADVAEAHLRAAARAEAVGRRIIVAGGFLWMSEMAAALASAFPDRRIATRVAPDPVLRLLALVDPSVRTVLPNLGRREDFDTALSRDLLGLVCREPVDSVVAAGRALLDLGVVR